MNTTREVITPPEPVVRITLELPEARARELGKAIDTGIVWEDTPVEDELEALYAALMGHS
jgi:hypothetical protein